MLERCGGQVNKSQHNFDKNYTTRANSDLVASILEVNKTKRFGEFESTEMLRTLSQSPMFTKRFPSEAPIIPRDLDIWTTEMMEYLHIGFRNGHLVWIPNCQFN